MTPFAKRLRALRHEKGLSQYALADLLGMPRSTYGNYETGIREPDFETAKRFAEFFAVPTDYLLGRTEFRAKTRLQIVRENSLLSQQDLSDRSGVAKDVILQYEAGGPEPRGYDIVRLATALGVSASYLLGQSDDPEIKDHLPPDWEKVVEEALQTGLSPDDVRRAMRMLRMALGQDNPDDR